jgi:hypothetical protein
MDSDHSRFRSPLEKRISNFEMTGGVLRWQAHVFD